MWKHFRDAPEPITITVTGTHGIGKSLFGVLFLIELIRFIRREKANGNEPTLCGHGLNGRIMYEHALRSRSTFYLIDVDEQSIQVPQRGCR